MTPEERLANEREALARADATLRTLLVAPALKETIYESVGSPRVLVRIFDRRPREGVHRVVRPYFCVVEVEDIAPYRSLNAEERLEGMLSLARPAAHARTVEDLVRLGARALEAAIFATPDLGHDAAYAAETGRLRSLIGAGDLAMIHYRTTRAIRQALRLVGEDI